MPIQWPGKIVMPMGGADAEDFAKRWEATFGAKDDRVPDRVVEPIGLIVCGAKQCRCRCPEGECEHKWDGMWWESEDGLESSSTCSICGAVRMFHDMRVGP